MQLEVCSCTAVAASAPPAKKEKGPITSELCDADCEKQLAGSKREKLSNGLEYQDVKVGSGAKPVKGYQVCFFVR